MDNLSHAERGHVSTTFAHGSRDTNVSVPSSEGHNSSEAERVPSRLQGSFRSLTSNMKKIVSSQEILTDNLKGRGRAAALQSLSHNLSHHRRYDTLWHRLLLNEQSEITRMEEMLADLDKKGEREPISRLQKQTLHTGYCLHPPCCCSGHKSTTCCEDSKNNSEKEAAADHLSTPCMGQPSECKEEDPTSHLSDMILNRLKRYSESVLLLHGLQKIPPTSRREWSSLYHTLKAEGVLESSDWDFLSFQDDFLSTRTERADQTFAALVYGDAPLSRLFRWVFKNRNRGDTTDETSSKTTIYLHTGGMESLKKGLVAAGSGIILMVPIGILLLQPMEKAISLVVVVCFGAAFVFALMLLGKTFDTMLFGFSAYSAVLVT
ncbi:hypothetical protein F4781DRAFT_438419 [Annulohypoxylon bovei var. microspora]|nr:hypothetical protein F4781DRAFT_438419 [Annulohypoxylon bovei var. microspora]